MTASTMGQRAEAAITAKAERDHAGLATIDPRAALVRFGSAVATRMPGLADRAPYNKARGFGLRDHHLLADVVGFYDEVQVRPAVEVWQPDANDQLDVLLGEAGFSPVARGSTLHMAPTRKLVREAPGLEIAELGRDDLDRYRDVLLDAYELPLDAPGLRRMFVHEHAGPGLRRYLALVDGAPAAVAALYSSGGTGLFVGAATLPAFRRRGCQAALITRRLADAAADSDLVVATAASGSGSQDHLVDHGFEITHHRTLWQRTDRAP